MNRSLVLGFFDGVHIAHRKVIQSVENPIVITFKESPAKFFGCKEEYILSRKNSIEKINALGVNDIVVYDFSKLAGMTAEEYLKYLVSKFSPAKIATGFNHTFGLNKEGNPNFLVKYQDILNYKYVCTQQQKYDNQIVSSTLIRKYLKEGIVDKAEKLLESEFLLEGTVIKGQQLGRKIGFPTANIIYQNELVKLPFGVYQVSVMDNKKAIMNWGEKPTVNNSKEAIIEVHIPNFEADLYGKNLKIKVGKRIRGEIKFSSIQELKTQIEKDLKVCIE